MATATTATQGRGSSAALGTGTGLLACLLVALSVSCSSDGGGSMTPAGPLVRLHPTPLDGSVTQASLVVTAQDPAGQEKQAAMTFGSAPFDALGVAFPVGTRGLTTYQVSLFKDASCPVGTGMAVLNLESDAAVDLTVPVTAIQNCGNSATLTVQLSNFNGGTGRVTSAPAGIDCTGTGAGCSVTANKGTMYMLTAQAGAGSFAGWSGGGCSGMGTCVVNLTSDVQVQAVFTTCRGWCKEQLPFAVTANLNGVSGTAPNNVLVVGDSGTALLWDGLRWQQLAVPGAAAGISLRAALGKSGGSVIHVAGDSGTILQLTGTTLKPITNTLSSAHLRGIGFGPGASPITYFVGDGTAALLLASGGTAVSAKTVQSAPTVSLFGICQNLAASKAELYIVGAQSGPQGFAESWDGNNMLTPQMTSPGSNVVGDINAVLCGASYLYAFGSGGSIVRRTVGGGANAWMTMASMANSSLRGAWAGAENNITAVGDSGTIVQYDGSAWSRYNSPLTTNLRAVWGSSPTNIYAVGEGGTVLHYLP